MKITAAVLLATLVLPVYAHAALVITKIVANPAGANAGRQWVEIMNTGTDPIDLGAKDIRFFTTSGNHLIKAYGDGGTVLSAGATGVIAQNPVSFLFDMPNYAGLVLKSAFTLSSTGIVGITQTDGTVLVRKSYVAPPTPAKPKSVSKSTTKRATTRTTSGTSKSQLKSSNKTSYGKGTVAPAASADAEAAGAVFALPSALAPLAPYLASMWFTAYLALLAFSGFSLIVIQRHYYV